MVIFEVCVHPPYSKFLFVSRARAVSGLITVEKKYN